MPWYVFFHEMVTVDPLSPQGSPLSPYFYNLANLLPESALPIAYAYAEPELKRLAELPTSYTVVQQIEPFV
jgi:hypothetical protein